MACILVIDDEEMVRKSMIMMLEAEGHCVIEAENGAIGINLCAHHLPDLVITDIFMPEKDGLEVIRQLQKNQPPVKIIAITGGGSVARLDLLPQARAFGARETLHKPFTRDALLQTVHLVLGG